MLRVRNIKLNYDHSSADLLKKITKKLRVNSKDIVFYRINKQSLDARKGLFYVYEIDVILTDDNKAFKDKDVFETPIEKYEYMPKGVKTLNHRPVIIGSGPAGLFAAYLLAENGYKPLIIERGEKIENRIKTVNEIFHF